MLHLSDPILATLSSPIQSSSLSLESSNSPVSTNQFDSILSPNVSTLSPVNFPPLTELLSLEQETILRRSDRPHSVPQYLSDYICDFS